MHFACLGKATSQEPLSFSFFFHMYCYSSLFKVPGMPVSCIFFVAAKHVSNYVAMFCVVIGGTYLSSTHPSYLFNQARTHPWVNVFRSSAAMTEMQEKTMNPLWSVGFFWNEKRTNTLGEQSSHFVSLGTAENVLRVIPSIPLEILMVWSARKHTAIWRLKISRTGPRF